MTQPIVTKQWFHGLLASPDLALDDWFDQHQALTDEVFLPHLPFQRYSILRPQLILILQLPLLQLRKIEAFASRITSKMDNRQRCRFFLQLLLNTHNKNGQSAYWSLNGRGLCQRLGVTNFQLNKNRSFNGKPLAGFDPAKFIREVVYIGTDGYRFLMVKQI